MFMFTAKLSVSELTSDVKTLDEVALYNKRFGDLSEHMTKEQTRVIVEFSVL